MEIRLLFVLARKSISTIKNETFSEKNVSTIQKNCFFWQRIQKWLPLAGKYFFVKIDSP